jgi:uncharacterized protein YbbK (DUF523 family)
MPDDSKIIVSACLAGEKCRYDGRLKGDEYIISLDKKNKAIPVCPEVLGGLPTPRERAEIESGDGYSVLDGKARVITALGEDVTDEYLRGAYAVLEISKAANVKKAILKSKSPSCGLTQIRRQDILIEGIGVTAALLARNGILLQEL